MTTYVKITNKKECHNGFQYHDGLNVLLEDFNANPKDSCCAGGLYFTTLEHVYKFYNFGIYLRIVSLPSDDPKFKIVKDPTGDKWRANMIILGERYSLDDVETYKILNIPYPDMYSAAKNNLFNLTKFLLENTKVDKKDLDTALIAVTRSGNIKMLQLLLDEGADIHVADDYTLATSIIFEKFDIMKFLIDKGANINGNIGFAFREAIRKGRFEIVKYLVEKGIDIHFEYDIALFNAIKFKQYHIAKFLIGSGCNIDLMDNDTKNDYLGFGVHHTLNINSVTETPL